jgi:glycosyltransferase involved in cell wall biosynthesis
MCTQTPFRGRTRILRVIARLNMGGPAHQTGLLSGRRMDPERYETLLVHGSLADGEQSLESVARAEGARTVFMPELVQSISPWNDARALRKLRALVRRFAPHVVHTHTAKAGFLGRQAALSAGKRRPGAIVHTYHGHVLEGYFSPAKAGLFRRLERSLGKRSDRLIGVSQATVDDLVRLGVAEPDRFSVVPLGLDLAQFTELGAAEREAARTGLGVGPDDVLCSYVGRVVPIKRVDLLLRGFAAARERAGASGVDLCLALAGDGETRAELEQLAGELGIAEAVNWLGYQSDLLPLAAAADIAVLSSANEGTPVSLIEGAAAGLPAVATKVGGVGEVVRDGETGLLVEPGDDDAIVNGIAAGIAQLAGDSGLRTRMGSVARGRASVRYSIERLLDDITGLYAELLD